MKKLIALLALLMTHTASAATITAAAGCNDGKDKQCYTIQIEGEIQPNDDIKLKQVIESNNITKAVVDLNSSGGNARTASLIAIMIHDDKRFDTTVKDGATCTSVCVNISLAGIHQYVAPNARFGCCGKVLTPEEVKHNHEVLERVFRPENRLRNVYRYYANIQFCYQVREGYAVTWINDVEMEKAYIAIKAIEKNLLAENSKMDTDAIWQQALKDVNGWTGNRWKCQQEKESLLAASPIETLQRP